MTTAQFDRVLDEYRILMQTYAAAQQRCAQMAVQHAHVVEQLQGRLMRQQAAVIMRDTALAVAREELAAFQAAVPGLARHRALVQHAAAQQQRIRALEQELAGWQQKAVQPVSAVTPPSRRPMPRMGNELHEKAILCVSTDGSGVAITQRLIEAAGGRFLHHDGADVTDPTALDASLVAADLVICQTGCVSQGAYWRVQDHCKRTGKQCVLVANPEALRVVHLHRPVTA